MRRTRRRCPDLTLDAPYSIEATTHAFSMRRGSRGERAGVRALPVFSRSRARVTSLAKREASISKRRRIFEEVGVGRLQDLQEDVLDLDVVVRPGEAEAGRPLESLAAGVVESTDQGLQVHAHLVVLSRAGFPQLSTGRTTSSASFRGVSLVTHVVHPSIGGSADFESREQGGTSSFRRTSWTS